MLQNNEARNDLQKIQLSGSYTAAVHEAYYASVKHLAAARERALLGHTDAALRDFQKALRRLQALPPERTRDILLAHAHLGRYQTLVLSGRRGGIEHLDLGVSYARSTRDPLARALAEECLRHFEVRQQQLSQNVDQTDLSAR